MAMTFWRGLGLAASFNGGHASNVTPGVDVNKIEFVAGPRYAFKIYAWHPGAEGKPCLRVFAQGLFGGVHAFNGFFPQTKGIVTSAGSSTIEVGGSLNLLLSKNFGVRLL